MAGTKPLLLDKEILVNAESGQKSTIEARILQLIAAGNHYSVAYGTAGVAKRTFMEWMQRGRDERAHRENGGRARKNEGRFLEFLEKVEQAEAQAHALLVTRWMTASKDDWRAARDFLARRFPQEWRERRTHELVGPDGGPIKSEVESRARVEVAGIDSDDERTAKVVAALVEAGVLPPEVAAALEWIDDEEEPGDDEDGSKVPAAQPPSAPGPGAEEPEPVGV